MSAMAKHIEFCVPAAKKVVPAGPDWIHEVKYDGYGGRLTKMPSAFETPCVPSYKEETKCKAMRK